VEPELDLGAGQPERGPEMGCQRHVAVPGVAGTERVLDRETAAKARIGDRDRLDRDRGRQIRPVKHAEQRALEGPHPRAVGARALGEKDRIVAGPKAQGEGIALAGALQRAALHEEASPEPAEQPD
jgi:hypothetical protein